MDRHLLLTMFQVLFLIPGLRLSFPLKNPIIQAFIWADLTVIELFLLVKFYFSHHVAKWSFFLREQVKYHLLSGFLCFSSGQWRFLCASVTPCQFLWPCRFSAVILETLKTGVVCHFCNHPLPPATHCASHRAFQVVGKICCVNELFLRGLIDNLSYTIQRKNLLARLIKTKLK